MSTTWLVPLERAFASAGSKAHESAVAATGCGHATGVNVPEAASTA
jgi:hypothetical protein